MHFGFTDEQNSFAEVVDDVLSALSSPEAVRAAWEAAPGALDRRLWDQLTDLGLTVALVGESSGGLGLDERDVTLVFERVGYHAAPGPLVESILVVPTFGEESITSGLATTNLGGDLVPCAADVDRLLLADASRSSIAVYTPAHVDLVPQDSVDGSRRLALVMPIGPGEVICDDADRIDQAYQRGVFGTSAMLIGLGQRMLDMTVEYVCDRRQFGVPVGSFQAIKHHCANALMALVFARPAVYRAGWSLATGSPNCRRDVAMAKVVASNAARQVGQIALQCHGAIAYTVEHNLHLYLKRSAALAASWGGCALHREVVARAIGADVTR